MLFDPMAGVHRFRYRPAPRASTSPGPTSTLAATEAWPVGDIPALSALRECMSSKPNRAWRGWIVFGFRWHTIGQTGERLARLVLPERYHADLLDHPVHPPCWTWRPVY